MVNLLNISRLSSIHLPDNLRPCCGRHALDWYQRGTRARKDYINCHLKILVWGNLAVLALTSGLDIVLLCARGMTSKIMQNLSTVHNLFIRTRPTESLLVGDVIWPDPTPDPSRGGHRVPWCLVGVWRQVWARVRCYLHLEPGRWN